MPAFRAMNAGCGGLTTGHDMPCDGEVTATGLRFDSYRSTVWQGFACEQHARLLIAPRRLLPRDRDVLIRRHERTHGQRTGARSAGEEDGPRRRRRTPRRPRRRGPPATRSNQGGAGYYRPDGSATGYSQTHTHVLVRADPS
jgi:hypothetical protein